MDAIAEIRRDMPLDQARQIYAIRHQDDRAELEAAASFR